MSFQEERGILPCCNCIATVPQDKIYAVEKFGSADGILSPGLNFVGFDVCGVCITFKSITTRLDQHIVAVPTVTSDSTFVQAVVAVQMAVNPERAMDAIYKMEDISSQLSSYATNVVRAQVPTMTLDQAFEKKEELSMAVQSTLAQQMAEFGWTVHKALIIDFKVNEDVRRAMNEINKQKRLRDASVMAAEAEKIRTVRKAEADADAADLQGQGIAKQRAAIIEGLRASIGSGKEAQLSTEDISTLLLTTQYFETLKEMGSRQTASTYFLPQEDEFDIDGQIRSGLLQGQVALQYMTSANGFVSNGGNGGGYQPPKPPQQSMNDGSASAKSRKQQQQQQQQQAGFSMPPSSPAAAPTPPPPPPRPQPPRPAAPPGQTVLQVQIPPGAPPGSTLQLQTPDGRTVQVQVPPGAGPGTTIQIAI